MSAEIWDLYDAQGRKTDKTMVRGEDVPQGLYHICVHIWPVNSRGELLIQRRAMTVQWKPGMWAVTGGSAITGEDAMTAARRELREELGVQPETLYRMACLRRTNSFCSVYLFKTDCTESEFVLQKEEVGAVRWCSMERLSQMIAEGTFYNYGDTYYKMLFEHTRRLVAGTL